MAALDSIRVVDLSRVLAGPFAAQMLADHGAEVIKVEAPGGDDTRDWGPPFDADGTAGYYRGLNRGKRNICIDLGSDDGRATVLELIRRADVVIENFKAGTMERWGLGFDDLVAALPDGHPGLVVCHISGYGDDGPLGGQPGYDAVLQAQGGLMSVNGAADGEPMRIGVPIVDLTAGLQAFAGVLLALHERTKSRTSQLVEATLIDAAVSLMHPHAANWFLSGTVPARTGTAHAVISPYQSFPTKQGPLFVAVGNSGQFRNFCRVTGLEHLLDDARFADNAGRIVNRAALAELISEATAIADREQLERDLNRAGVPAGPVNDVGEVLRSPQVLHRQMVVGDGDYRGTGVPIKLSHTPGAAGTAPRRKGADTLAVLAELGIDAPTSALDDGTWMVGAPGPAG